VFHMGHNYRPMIVETMAWLPLWRSELTFAHSSCHSEFSDILSE
jgi:hypothetical protein